MYLAIACGACAGVVLLQVRLWRKFNRLWYQNFLNISALMEQAKLAGEVEFEKECERYLCQYYKEKNLFL